MKVNYTACAICDSNWGNLWEEVEGERLFFCCDLCALQFRNLVARIERETGWPSVDRLSIAGDRRGRTCTAYRGTSSYACTFTFNAEGEIRTFRQEPGVAPDPLT